MFVYYRAGGAQVRNAVHQTFQIGDAMTYAAALRVTGFALLALGCLLNARTVNADPVFGDRIQILLNPAPGSGSIFKTVYDLTQAPIVGGEGDITLPEGSKEKVDFYFFLTREFIGYAAAKTTIFLSDDAGLSDALVVTKLTEVSLEFQFFSDGESPLKLTDFPGPIAANIPETGNADFPGIGAEALLNITSLIFPNAPAGTTFPITVLIGSDRDLPAPPTLPLLCLGVAIVLATRVRSLRR